MIECVAEASGKPLFPITCGEYLGNFLPEVEAHENQETWVL